MAAFDIQINLKIDATTEQRAEQQAFEFLRAGYDEFSKIYRVIDWEFIEFIPEGESTDVGCSTICC